MRANTPLTTVYRDNISAKISFLSMVIGQTGELLDKGIMGDNDFFAITLFLDEIADEIYPEHSTGHAETKEK
jgi:hypothetical protein